MNKYILVAFVFFATTSFCSGQNHVSSDELFKEARNAAFEQKDYEKTKGLAYQALAQSPGYADIDIFLGRIFTWNHEYDKQ